MHAHSSSAGTMAGRPDPLKWLGLGTLLAGTADLVFASVFWAVKADVPPIRIFQSIASGLLGESSFAQGAASATLGLVLHYTIIAGMMAAYYAVAQRVPRLVAQWLTFGAVYGLWLYVAMTWIVVPLSAADTGSRNPLWMVMSVGMHVIIGIACAWFARRAMR